MRNPLVKISKAVLMTAAALIPVAGLAGPLPQGGNITGGQGSISQSGSQMTIHQTSQTFSVDWQSFSVGAGNGVHFVQPSSGASVLNRVLGGNPTEILGNISANGRVFLVNPAGITFAAGSSVNVGSLVASTLDISPGKFHSSEFVFEGDSRSAVTNLGTLQAATGGSVALIAAKIENQGQISAERGSVAMGAGSRVRLSFGGLASLEVEAAAVDAAIEQSGGVRADGGSVLLTARAANNLASAVVNHTGVIEARTLSVDAKGSIILDGGDGSVVAIGRTDASGSAFVDGGSVAISGGFTSLGGVITADGSKGGSIAASGSRTLSLADTVAAKGLATDGGIISYSSASRIIEIGGSNTDASGLRNGGSITVTAASRLASSGLYSAKGVTGNGGRIDMTAADLRLLTATLDASGGQNGGLVRLGGAFQGGKAPDTSAAYYDFFLGRWGFLPPIANASQAFVNDGTKINVSGANGAGGSSVVWSDVQTTFLGGIDARGKISGGSAEISSAGTLRQASLVNVQLGDGKLLLDPKDITIGDASIVKGWSYAGIMGLFYGDSSPVTALEAGEMFGTAVAFNAVGDRLAVGAMMDGGNGNIALSSGAVYLFDFTGANFAGGSFLGMIGKGYVGGKNVNIAGLAANSHFGASVALNALGDRLAVGAIGDAGFGASAAASGAVYLIGFTDTSFSGGLLQGVMGKGYTGGKNVNVPSLASDDQFGSAVALNALGDRLAVGARGDGGFFGAFGAVHLFEFQDTNFSGGISTAKIDRNFAGGYFYPSTLQSGDTFGSSLSLSAAGDLLAVGAPGDDGDGNLSVNSGAVYLFNFTSGSFGSPIALGVIGKGYAGGKNLDIPTLDAYDNFGAAVALNATGDLMVVGATGDAGAGNSAWANGSVGLFSFTDNVFSGGSLIGTIGVGYGGAKNIDLPDLPGNGYFGGSVALNAAGDRLAVGAWGDAGAMNNSPQTGAAYLFGFSDSYFGGGLLLGAIGKPYSGVRNMDVSALEGYDYFGSAVAFNYWNDRMAVGAMGDSGAANGTNYSGAVYLFSFTGASFENGALEGVVGKGYTGGKNVDVPALAAYDYFGSAVSLNTHGDLLAVGAKGDDGSGDVATNTGAVHLFQFSDSYFSGGALQGTIGKNYTTGKNVNLALLDDNDAFGSAVSLRSFLSNRLVVGAPGDDGAGNATNEAGAVHLFTFNDGAFSAGSLVGTIGAGYAGGRSVNVATIGVQASDQFGSAVSLNYMGDRLAVGAPGDDGAGNAVASSGAVYLMSFTSADFYSGALSLKVGSGYSGANELHQFLGADARFGSAVALNGVGERLAVGAPGNRGPSYSVNEAGAVFLYSFPENTFYGSPGIVTIGKGYNTGDDIDLIGLAANTNFGASVSFNYIGDRLAVGATGDAGANRVDLASGAVYLFAASANTIQQGSLFATYGEQSISLLVSDLKAQLEAGTSITLQASNDIRLSAPLSVVPPVGVVGGDLTLQAGRSIFLDESVTTGGGNLTLTANDLASNGVIDQYRDPGIALITTDAINAGGGALVVRIRDGWDKTYSAGGNVTLGPVAAGSLSVNNVVGPTDLSSLAVNGNLSVVSNGSIQVQSNAGIFVSGNSAFSSSSGGLFINSMSPGYAYFAGDVVAFANTVYLGDVSFGGDLHINANHIYSQGQLAVSGVTSLYTGSLDLFNTSANFVGAVDVNATYDVSVFNFTAGSTVSIHSAQGGVSLQSNGALVLGNVHAAGSITAETTTGNLSIDGLVNSTTGSITLNAGSAGQAGLDLLSGDLLLGAGGQIAVSANARATLYTGSLAGSTAIAGAIGAGSGRFRYGSDESSTAYTTPLGTGSYLIYRERPAISVSIDSQTIDYGQGLPALTGSITSGSLRNGDTASYSVVGSSLSSAGFIKADSYAIIAPSPAALGYNVSSSNGTLTVARKSLTTAGLSAAGKTYDAGLSATLTGTAAIASGAANASDGLYYGADAVSLTGTASGAFATKDADTGKTVTVSGLSLAGGDAANYQLDTLTLTADILKKTLTVSGLSASNKTYDSGLGATLTGTAIITAGAANGSDGLYYGTDTVSVTGTAAGAFATKDADAGKTVTVSGLSLAGGDSANYQLDAISLTADITKKTLTVSGLTASNKTYDSGLGATLMGTAAITAGAANASDGLYYGADSVSLTGTASGAFATQHADTGKTVTVSGLSLAGGDSANYQLDAISLSADIAKKTLTVSGLAATSKTYDAGLGATVIGTAAITAGAANASDGLYYGTDTVSLSGTAAGTFTTKDADTGKTVTVSGLSLVGGDAANYQLDAIGLTADITRRTIGLRADDKTKAVGAADPVLTYALVSGSLASGDSFSGAISRSLGEVAGDYAISMGSLSAGQNYTVNFTPAVFRIVAPSTWRDSIPQVSLVTNPLWQTRPGLGMAEIAIGRPQVIWVGAGRYGELPQMRSAERGPFLLTISAQPGDLVPSAK